MTTRSTTLIRPISMETARPLILPFLLLLLILLLLRLIRRIRDQNTKPKDWILMMSISLFQALQPDQVALSPPPPIHVIADIAKRRSRTLSLRPSLEEAATSVSLAVETAVLAIAPQPHQSERRKARATLSKRFSPPASLGHIIHARRTRWSCASILLNTKPDSTRFSTSPNWSSMNCDRTKLRSARKFSRRLPV